MEQRYGLSTVTCVYLGNMDRLCLLEISSLSIIGYDCLEFIFAVED